MLMTGKRETRQEASWRTNVIPLVFDTCLGPIAFNVLLVEDVEVLAKIASPGLLLLFQALCAAGAAAGPLLTVTLFSPPQETDGLRGGIFHGAQCVIAMIDLTSPPSAQNFNGWLTEIWRMRGNIPTASWANEVDDVEHRQIATITKPPGRHTHPHEASAKDVNDAGKAFLWLAKMLWGDAQLHFVARLDDPQPHGFVCDLVHNSSLLCQRRNFTQHELDALVMLRDIGTAHSRPQRAHQFLTKWSQSPHDNNDPHHCLAMLVLFLEQFEENFPFVHCDSYF